MSTPTEYEREQMVQIREWREEKPSFASRTFGKATAPAAEAIERVIPTAALRLALDSVHKAAVRLADRRSILRHAQLDDILELRKGSLEVCDVLAARVRNRAVLLSGGSGALFGVVGTFGMVMDVPTLLTIAFRTIHRTGLCYGEEFTTPLAQRLPVAVFALASSNTLGEKQAALEAIDRSEQGGVAWREGVERVAERELAKDAAIFSLNNLAKTVGRRIGLSKAAESIPITGALIGGGVNAWYLYDVARTARHVFQMRWLRGKYGEVPALAAPVESG